LHCYSDCIQRRRARVKYGTFIWYVTASLKIDYLRPTLINEPVNLRARVRERRGRKTVVTCSLFSRDQECVRAEILAVHVPPDWFKER
jgi:acyl-CoA thioesterase FadM